ncbi:hypothetical protein D3C72_2089820 [compost metagenome]
MVDRAGGGDDHLAVALGERAFFLQHQRVVVREEGPPLGGAARKAEEHVGHEAGLFLHGKDRGADVVGQVFQFGEGVARGVHLLVSWGSVPGS